MVYYLVGIFDKASCNYIESLQKAICEKYDLYRDDKNLPMLHVTLEILTSPNVQDLDVSLKNILLNYTKLQIQIDGVICFDPPFKSVNLNIKNKGTIYELSKNLNSILKSQGFIVREDIESWNLHISLASTNFADREWSNTEYLDACHLAKDVNVSETITMHAVELWKPINDKDQMVVKRYDL